MKTKSLTICLLLFSIYLGAQTLSPVVISASGGFYQAGGVTLSSTIAEMTMVDTYITSSSIVTQGFQQPEILTTLISEDSSPKANITVYPNPTNGNCFINFTTSETTSCSVKITSMVGQVILDQLYIAGMGENILKVDLSLQSSGIYFLEIRGAKSFENRLVNIYKINLIH
jgi:hypothetical protein